MSYPTFSPPFAPMQPLEDQVQPRFISAKFGDGYTQLTIDGQNPEQSSIDLTFSPLSVAQWQAMEAFLLTNAGLPFYYSLATDGVQRIWVCQKWSAPRQANHYTGVISINQVFPLGG